MGREGAGRRAWETRRDNAMRAQMSALRAQYDSPGKREVRRLLVAVAKQSKCSTWLEFFGGGELTEHLVAEGFDVTAVESDARVKPLMLWAAGQWRFTAVPGKASRVSGSFDVVFADFCGHLTESGAEAELASLAKKTRRWLAVTINPDHQSDTDIQAGKSRAGGRYADVALAARLMAVTGMRLAYLRRYQRNERKQWMWFAVLEGVGLTAANIDPIAIHREMSIRGYWCSMRFRKSFADHLPHRVRVATERVREKSAERSRTDGRRAYFARYRESGRAAELQRAARAADPERYRAYDRAFHERHRAERNARQREYDRRRREVARASAASQSELQLAA